jgi:hypothetical protein
MTRRSSRRCFVQLAALGGGAFCLGPSTVRAGATEEELKTLREELAIKLQTRQVDERMVLFKRLVAKYGKALIAEVEANTVEQARTRFASADLEHRDLEGVKQYLWNHLGQGFDFETVEDTPTRLAFKVKRCFLAEAVAEHGAPELGHAFYCAWDEGFCQGLNPKIRFTRTKTLMAGQGCCDHTYELG